MTDTVRVTLQTVTPLFLGGADPNEVCELRAPSIKHQLRFWFRFLEGARQGGQWDKVLAEEEKIFGRTDRASSFKVRIRKAPPMMAPKQIAQYCDWPIEIGYLGYGPVGLLPKREREARQAKGLPATAFRPQRPFMDANQEIQMDLIFETGALYSPRAKTAVLEALWLWTHLGGLGSRARRGWGSMQLVAVSPDAKPAAALGACENLDQDILAQVQQWAGNCLSGSTQRPRFSHWQPNFVRLMSRPQNTTGWRDWQEAARWLGDRFLQFRSNYSGRRGTKPCWNDHELVRKYLDQNIGAAPAEAPRRSVFGLPENYMFSNRTLPQNPKKASVVAILGDNEIDRRGSPLFVHYHRFGDDTVGIVLMAVEAEFLPDKARVLFEPDYERGPHDYDPPKVPVSPPADYQVLQDFLATL